MYFKIGTFYLFNKRTIMINIVYLLSKHEDLKLLIYINGTLYYA